MTLSKYMLIVSIFGLSCLSWQCKPPDPCDLNSPPCRENADCGNQLICWMCECIPCSRGMTPCGSGSNKICISLSEDRKNCGACGHVCPESATICKKGKCTNIPKQPKERLISTGIFQMGSPNNELGRYPDEYPHKVRIHQAFYIWQTEITQQEFERMGLKNRSFFTKCGANCPVEQVNWHQAALFCNKMSQKYELPECFICKETIFEDKDLHTQVTRTICSLKDSYRNKRGEPDPTECWGYRLPTEAEWEYAARAGTKTATYNGEINATACSAGKKLNEIAWYCGNSEKKVHPVKTKKPNKWKLYDMLGNVREWVWDFYGKYPQRASTDPIGALTGSGRVVRGGCWSCRAQETRASYRFDHSPLRKEYNLGFRIVRNAQEP